MNPAFFSQMIIELQKIGYTAQKNLDEVQSLAYLRSETRKAGFAKVENHFLFVDWDSSEKGDLGGFLFTYQEFSRIVNRSYPIPHGFRLHFPNLVLVGLSENNFSQEAIEFTVNRYMNPWIGGETGQLMLINTTTKEFIHHSPPYYRQSGLIPLQMAVDDMKYVLQKIVYPG